MIKLVNSIELNKFIKKSGLKRIYIAKKLNISAMALRNKINNITEFKPSEIIALKTMLSLSNEDIQEIFFANNVAFK